MIIGPGIGVGYTSKAAGGAAAAYNPLTAIAWKAAYWASDPLWTPPADGGAVSSWRDGGSEAKNAEQATGANQPLFRSSAALFNNKPTVEFDGTNDALQSATWGVAIGAVACTFVAIAKLDATTSTRPIISDVSAAAFMHIGSETTAYAIRRGGSGASGGTANTAAAILLVGAYAGASGGLTLDIDAPSGHTTPVSGGTGGTASMTGVCLGNALPSGGRWLDGQIAFAGVYVGTPDLTAFKAWAGPYYGLTIA